jgi:hypothetical protein
MKGQRVGRSKTDDVTYGYSANVEQIVHAKHLLVGILDNAESVRGSLFDGLATMQPLSAGVGEADPGKIPETSGFAVRARLDPRGWLSKRDV